jgi:hypothetical protein
MAKHEPPTPPTGGVDELPADALDSYAETVAATDPGPDVLDVADEPDPATDRDPGPRPEDGPQDASQDPGDTEATPGGDPQ